MIKSKFIIVIAISLITLNLVGCNNKIQSQQESGLQVNILSTALGAVNVNSMEEQKLTYSFGLTNYNKTEVYIKSIEPIISDTFKKMLWIKQSLLM